MSNNWNPTLDLNALLEKDEHGLYLPGDSSANPNLPSPVDPKILECLEVLFPQKEVVIEFGSGRSSPYLNYLNSKGYGTLGFDLHPGQDNFATWGYRLLKMDMREPKENMHGAQYALCVQSLLYLTLPEIAKFLKYMFGTFTDRALLYTPASDMQLMHDPKAISFIDTNWLAWACNQVGGYAFVLNFYKDMHTGFGPAVYWMKGPWIDVGGPSSFWSTRINIIEPLLTKLKTTLSDERFSITIA